MMESCQVVTVQIFIQNTNKLNPLVEHRPKLREGDYFAELWNSSTNDGHEKNFEYLRMYAHSGRLGNTNQYVFLFKPFETRYHT